MVSNGTPQPTNRDIAECFRLLLDLGLLFVLDVVSWADSVIESLSEAPEWAIDLSLAKKASSNEIEAMLNRVPGDTTKDLPRKMASSVVREKWLAQKLTDQGLIDAWFKMYPDYPVEGDIARHAADVWQWLDEVLMSVHARDRHAMSLERARAEIALALDSYAQFRSLLPLA